MFVAPSVINGSLNHMWTRESIVNKYPFITYLISSLFFPCHKHTHTHTHSENVPERLPVYIFNQIMCGTQAFLAASQRRRVCSARTDVTVTHIASDFALHTRAGICRAIRSSITFGWLWSPTTIECFVCISIRIFLSFSPLLDLVTQSYHVNSTGVPIHTKFVYRKIV